jgi:hypothetical protein
MPLERRASPPTANGEDYSTYTDTLTFFKSGFLELITNGGNV